MDNTKRFCLTIELKDSPELMEEYIHWHKPENIWPEITKGIRQVGILEMEIYIHKNILFMIVDAPVDFDWDKQMKELATLPRQAEWETFVSKYQKAREGSSSGEKWLPPGRIFKLTDC